MKSLIRTLLPWLPATAPWLLAASAASADADVVRWLYDVEVPVASQGERPRAARTGLAELLVRVTGMADVPPNPEIQAALREPQKYYGRFEFSTRPIPGAGETEPAEQMFVALHYEPAMVLALLRRAGLPVWSADRPRVHAWIAVEQDNARHVLSASDGDELAAAVQQRVRRRGLELSLPLMDLTDRTVTPTVVWGRFWRTIEAASMRYAPDVIVLGRAVQRIDGTWMSDWELRSAPWPRTGADLEARLEAAPGDARDAVADGVDLVVDVLADRFAVGGRLDAIAVTIRGASTIAAYASVLDYLRSREYVERLEVKAVARDALTLHLHSRSSSAQLAELLAMGGPLAAPPGRDGRGDDRTLEFAWRGDG